MELRQIKYFIEVAQREHITQAAEHLHIAQSAISRQISNLEEELGVQLFIREGRNVKLTPFGRVFLNRIKKAMSELDRATQEVHEYLDPEKGQIRVGFPHSLASKMVPQIISAFKQRYPDIRFHLHVSTVVNLVEDVVKGELDMAFVAPVPLDSNDVEGNILFTEEILAILPPKHKLAEEQFIQLSELREDPFVLFTLGLSMRKIILDACEKAGFTPNIAFEGEEIDTIRGLVEAGLGVGLLPEVSLTGAFREKHVKISDPKVTRTVGFIVPRERKLSPSEDLFRNFVFDYYKKT